MSNGNDWGRRNPPFKIYWPDVDEPLKLYSVIYSLHESEPSLEITYTRSRLSFWVVSFLVLIAWVFYVANMGLLYFYFPYTKWDGHLVYSICHKAGSSHRWDNISISFVCFPSNILLYLHKDNEMNKITTKLTTIRSNPIRLLFLVILNHQHGYHHHSQSCYCCCYSIIISLVGLLLSLTMNLDLVFFWFDDARLL